MLDNNVIARYAPSPTGDPHAGNIFAYLLTWLIARKADGRIVCRIEDLDTSRSRPEYVSSFLNMIEETGLDFDEGPYFQSDNKELYDEIYNQFNDAGLIYPCFCTRRDLSFQSAPHQSDGLTVYDRRCLKLDESEIAEKSAELAKSNRSPSYRLMTDSREILFDDVVYGPQKSVLDSDCGDFVLKRADNDYAYHLAVVADDIEEGVNLVSRGCDLLSSTPQQIYLYQLLGKDAPTYAHFPLLCAKDGRRLAKRDRDATYDSLKASLGSPERVIGHIAYVSGLIDENEAISPSELLLDFDIESARDKFNETKSIVFE